MPKRKRHSPAEIAAKLAQAEQLIAQGRRQQEVARSLGVSVMTFHRWRKASPPRHRAEMSQAARRVEVLSGSGRLSPIAELELENERLRRVLTDLLLDRVAREDLSGQRRSRI